MEAVGIEFEVMNVFFTFQTPPDTSLEKGEEDEGEESAIGWRFEPMVWANKNFLGTWKLMYFDVHEVRKWLVNGL